MLDDALRALLHDAGVDAVGARRLSGGSVAEVLRVADAAGATRVVKVDRAPSDVAPLLREAAMLRFLGERSTLPVPRVLASTAQVLVLQDMPGATGFAGAEGHAAALLAALHDVTAERYGFPFPAAIGGLHQDSTWSSSWRDFFRDRRLLAGARAAVDEGRLPATTARRLERFAARLHDVVDEPPRPALVHGDVWSGNVLSAGDRVTAFLDPATCFADGEQDLAFIALFATAGEAFFAAYEAHRPIRPGRVERWRAYDLWPLLIHVRLFGGAYVDEVDARLRALPGS
jgi:fructosamine-3-kinase